METVKRYARVTTRAKETMTQSNNHKFDEKRSENEYVRCFYIVNTTDAAARLLVLFRFFLLSPLFFCISPVLLLVNSFRVSQYSNRFGQSESLALDGKTA